MLIFSINIPRDIEIRMNSELYAIWFNNARENRKRGMKFISYVRSGSCSYEAHNVISLIIVVYIIINYWWILFTIECCCGALFKLLQYYNLSEFFKSFVTWCGWLLRHSVFCRPLISAYDVLSLFPPSETSRRSRFKKSFHPQRWYRSWDINLRISRVAHGILQCV